MRKVWMLALTCIAIAPSTASADWFHKLVRYRCDKANNTLIVSYVGAYNKEGEALLAGAGKDDWDPWQLLKMHDGKEGSRVMAVKTERRVCQLQNRVYKVAITGEPGNWNLGGRCGANASAMVKIESNGKSVYRGYFEGDCHGAASILTEIEVKPGSEPQLKVTPNDEFYR